MSIFADNTAQDAPPQARGLIGVDHIWCLLPLVLFSIFIALVPTLPHDFWWHLRAGQIIAEQGIPTTNIFAWTLPDDHPYIYAAWLSELLFYRLYQLGGLAGPVLARNLLGVAGLALVAIEARRRSGSWRMAGLAVLLVGLMSINNLTTRPQNWAWVLFGLLMLVLGAYSSGQIRPLMLAALPAIMVVWVNIHGSFALGLVLAGIVAGGETLRRLLGQPGALEWRRLLALYLAGLAMLGAILINPSGIGILGYVSRLLGDPTIQGLVNEWQPPAIGSLAGMFFYGSVLGVLAAFGLGSRRPSLTDVLVVCALLWLAWGSQRNVFWYGMAAMPILAGCLAGMGRPAPPADIPSTVIGLVLLGALVAVQPPFKAGLPLPEPYKRAFAVMPGAPELFSADTPIAAVEYLRAHPINGRLFNDMGYGSYLTWALYPQAQVFIDARIELYPAQLWRDYVAISMAENYNHLLIDTYQVDRILLSKATQSRLATALANDPRWVREYSDARTEIYRRTR